MQKLIEGIDNKLIELSEQLDREELVYGQFIFNNNECQLLTQSAEKVEVIFSEVHVEEEMALLFEIFEDAILIENTLGVWNRFSYAALLLFQHELHLLDEKEHLEHKKYTREGMIKRVIAERQQKALSAEYRVDFASNIYGDHIVTNENGVKYKVFLRDFENETGYSNSKDAEINKLGTTKHIMYVFNKLKTDTKLYKRLSKVCPFVEIYLNPLDDYKISWFYPHKLPQEIFLLIKKYFGNEKSIDDTHIEDFAEFISEVRDYSNVLVRPEVLRKIEKLWEQRSLEVIVKNYEPDFSSVKADLYTYQKEGIAFAACKKGAIIADEMGLGKTIQAIGIALQKKELFGFSKVLVVCPASLKSQWKNEIEKFSQESAVLIQGNPEERALLYKEAKEMFQIINYETVLRDQEVIREASFDFLILDEAQRVKNFATKTAAGVKKIQAKHTLIITGTPIENKLVDLFSLVAIIDENILGPLWEFSYQHCLFDSYKTNKINGYFNLQELKEKLKEIILRREKRHVLDQLPNVQQHDIRVGMTSLQADYHASYASGISQIVHKKFLTPYDMKMLQMLLSNMRMVCDSTYLIDDSTNESPKLDELKYILLEKLDVKNSSKKIIIFSEWVKVHKLIGVMLRENNIGFAELNGRVPVHKRGELIKRFETNDSCKVFLSTEAGGAGLNLQVADTLINFELPWNPAKKNQRIGRIDRLGQKSNHLTIFNFITTNSIEERISLGLLVKQSLFDGVLNSDSQTNFVDFSEKGRSQFMEQITAMVENIETADEEVYQDEIDSNNYSSDEIVDEEITEDIEVMPERKTVESSVSYEKETKAKKMEEVMNNGIQFLAGLMEMATGEKMDAKEQKIEVDPISGEVTMKFKMPF